MWEMELWGSWGFHSLILMMEMMSPYAIYGSSFRVFSKPILQEFQKKISNDPMLEGTQKEVKFPKQGHLSDSKPHMSSWMSSSIAS